MGLYKARMLMHSLEKSKKTLVQRDNFNGKTVKQQEQKIIKQ